MVKSFIKKKKKHLFNADFCRQDRYLNETTIASEDINVMADVSTDTNYLSNTLKVPGINLRKLSTLSSSCTILFLPSFNCL